MAGEWKTALLAELCEQIADCPHSTPLWTDNGVIVLRNQNIRDGRLDLSTPSYTDEPHFEQRSRRARLRAGDLVLTREAPMGEVCMIPERLRCCLGQRMVMLRPDPKKCDSRFLLYSIQSEAVQHEIKVNEGTGSTVSNLRIPLLEALPIPYPPLPEQEAIAAALGALDDQIELNRRMNATLEAMARALFQSWFVDFDPVRAKLDGRQPHGLDPATADLFPSSFEDSLLGHIPTGWETGSILRQADLMSGGTPKTDVPAYWNGDVPWASAKDVSQCGEAFLISTERTITEQGVQESSTKIIPTNATVVVARGATTGRLTMFGHPMAMNQTCYGLRSRIGAPFALYCHARDVIERLVQGGHGSIFDTITTSTFEATDVLLAPKELLLTFDQHVTPLFEQIRANLHQSRTLVTLRDTLLPKLLSGELSVRSASHTVDAAA
jgi:type I restriction enzyme, S subunit